MTNGPGSAKIFRNDDGATFTETTAGSGLDDFAFYWQPILYDFNGDGRLDIYQSTDAAPNSLWINQGDGTFVDQAVASGTDSAWNDMGICLGDYDNDGDVDGALVLMRDVSELRNRERLLVSMDATIREIHHRVKNNLQTVSSLLRIQGRRVAAPEAKAAIAEAERRIASIAVVHEMLSRGGGDEVLFGDVVRPILDMAESAGAAPVRIRLVGEGPVLSTMMASSLAVVLNELVQNAVEHGYPPGSDGGTVTVELVYSSSEMIIRVHDDGVGIPADFDLEAQNGLGLTIINTLVKGELGGSLSIRPASTPDHGTVAQLTAALPQR